MSGTTKIYSTPPSRDASIRRRIENPLASTDHTVPISEPRQRIFCTEI